jgi:hypothetical protein
MEIGAIIRSKELEFYIILTTVRFSKLAENSKKVLSRVTEQ